MSFLSKRKFLFILWSFTAAFLAYASMYAFRKPFNAATYEEQYLWGLPLKGVLVMSQIIGYMVSKFVGIKVISELTKGKRIPLILVLIGIAHLALLGFAVVPVPWKFLLLFLNGIPLGMVWGVIFSFLEGRRLTELIATGIAVGAIVASGVVKSIARYLMDNPIYEVTQFWMPFAVGLLFLPLLLLAVWMLSKIPPPDAEDVIQKTRRQPLQQKERIQLLRAFLPGIAGLVFLYVALTIFRDYRDNYAVEILEYHRYMEATMFANMELVIAGVVLLTSSLTIFFKNNEKGFNFCLALFAVGFLLMLLSLGLFHAKFISAYTLMLLSGLGMAMGYVPFQIVVLERFIAMFRINGNVGFLMYLADSLGYLGSVALILSEGTGLLQAPHYLVFENLILICGTGGLALTVFAYFYFKRAYREKSEALKM